MPTFDFTAPDGTTHSIDGPEGATREQAFQMLHLKLGGGTAPAAPKESFGSDIAKSAGSGLEQGTATALGLPGDLASLAHSVAPQGVVDAVKSIPGAKFVYDHLPTSQAVLNSASDPLVDPNYEPQSATGRYTKAIAAQAGPGLATGMGVPAVVGGAVAGQGVEDLTGSKTAGAVANIAGSIAAPMALARLTRTAPMALRNAEQIKRTADTRYAEPAISQTYLTPPGVAQVARDMRAELANAGSPFLPAQAPRVHAGLDALEDASVNGRPVSFAELHGFRKSLGEIGQETHDFKPTEQALAAGSVKRVLGNYLDNVPAQDVIAGDPARAADAIKTAGRDWHAASSAERIGNAIGNAEEQNASVSSAMNLGNILRSQFRPFLKNDSAKLKSMGFGNDPEVVDGIRNITRGDFTTNTLRRASNMLGGGGGIASTIIGHGISSAGGGLLGYEQGGLPGMAAGTVVGAIPGQVLRLAANARTRAAAQRVQDALLSRAPDNAAIVAHNTALRAAQVAARRQALLRNGIPAAAMQAIRITPVGNGR